MNSKIAQNSIRNQLKKQLFSNEPFQKPEQNKSKCKPNSSPSSFKQPLNSFTSTDTQSTKAIKNFEDHYTLLNLIGQGGHASVYRARDNKTHRLIAVKICRTADPEITMNFIKTFKNSKKLRHPMILKCQEIYIEEETETLYLVMEYCEYPTLEQLYQKNPISFNEAFVKKIAKSILSAVAYIHQKGICHRDIKLDNILVMDQIFQNDTNLSEFDRIRQNLTPDSPTLNLHQIKIIDFDVSKQFIDGEMWTRTGNVFYCAPEIFDGCGYNEKVDCWSIGVILYYLLSGTLPFQEETIFNTVESILSKELIFNQPHISKLGKDLIQRLLTKNPIFRISAETALQHPWFYEENQLTLFNLNSKQENGFSFDEISSRKTSSIKNLDRTSYRNLDQVIFPMQLQAEIHIKKKSQSLKGLLHYRKLKSPSSKNLQKLEDVFEEDV